LEPHSSKIVGIDISEAPVGIFNEWVSKNGIPSEKMYAVAIELKGEEGELEGIKFDVITVSIFPSKEIIISHLSFICSAQRHTTTSRTSTR